MNKKFGIGICVLIAFLFIEWGKDILPMRLEVDEVQVTEVIGIDLKDNEEVSLSIVFEEANSNGKDGSDGGNKSNERIVNVISDSFSANVRGLQNYGDKIFIGSHVKNIIMGENMAKNDMMRGLEYISKNSEIRTSSNIYIAKESEASELFAAVIDNEDSLADRVNTIAMNSKTDNDKREVTVLEWLNIFLSDDRTGVIPAIKIVDNGDRSFANYVIDEITEPKAKRIEWAGYGIIKDGNLVGYLTENESEGYEYINGLIGEDAITLKKGDKTCGINLVNCRTNIKFDFDGDRLNKVIIKVSSNNFVKETFDGENIFSYSIDEIESLENEYISAEIRSAVTRAQNDKIDFLGIGKILSVKHPYKWRVLKDKWKEIFPTIPIEIEVKSQIDRAYNILSITNKK